MTVRFRVAQLGDDWGKKAAKLHLSYLERDGVAPDGSPGTLYDAQGVVRREDFEKDIPGEKHQFRVVISPEDGHELDLKAYVRSCMARVERDLGRKLQWAAANHYNTDDPHAHVVIRGVDANGREFWIDREYISHGMRHRAAELATEELGPRPEKRRLEQLKREVTLERYTSLDASLERRAVAGIVETGGHTARDPHLESALKQRLVVLETVGLASREKGGRWKLSPALRPELQRRQRRAEALRAIGGVLDVDAEHCRVIDRDEPLGGERQDLERGVQGLIRSKGLDEQGRFIVVVETTAGHAYHLPIAGRVAHDSRVGQLVELKKAVDKDAAIEGAARDKGWVYDLGGLEGPRREAYRSRLTQLERAGLATREAEGTERWKIRPDFRAELAKGKQQAYWQYIGVHAQPLQPLAAQITYEGHTWLDRVKMDQIVRRGFGQEVDDALRRRYEYLRGLGLQPQGEKLRWELLNRQQRRLEQSIAKRAGGERVWPSKGFEGTARLHRESNGEAFLEVRSGQHFFVRHASREETALDGQRVRVQLGDKRRVLLERVEREQGRER